MHDRAGLNRVDVPHIVTLRRWPQPWGDVSAPDQVNEDDRHDDQRDYSNANKRADEPGEEPSQEYAQKNARKETKASPLEAPALRSTRPIASVHSDPRITDVHSLEPPCRIDCPPEYSTRTRISFTFRAHSRSALHAIERSAMRSGFNSGILRPA